MDILSKPSVVAESVDVAGEFESVAELVSLALDWEVGAGFVVEPVAVLMLVLEVEDTGSLNGSVSDASSSSEVDELGVFVVGVVLEVVLLEELDSVAEPVTLVLDWVGIVFVVVEE